MKKRVITLLVAVIMVSTLLAGCGEEITTTKIITSTKAETVVGSYELFRTQDVQDYLNFLENLDETKYEIVDISVTDGYYASDEWYFVTYKKISE